MNIELIFKQAIHSKNKVKLIFYSKEDGKNLERICAPMDFGPSRRSKNKDERYHLWDYESDQSNHVLSLLPIQVINIEILNNNFDPSEFITWDVKKSPWFYIRDWGHHS
ncbi:hypothetical protein ABTP12_14815 [Acinetobacter baumannii]|nr:hypothetical protein [Acinetobacter baumannii]